MKPVQGLECDGPTWGEGVFLKGRVFLSYLDSGHQCSLWLFALAVTNDLPSHVQENGAVPGGYSDLHGQQHVSKVPPKSLNRDQNE